MAEASAVMLSFPSDKPASSPQEYDQRMTAYLKQLDKLPRSVWSTTDKQNPRELLDPAVNSLPYLLSLLELAKGIGTDRQKAEEFLSQASVFFASFDPVQVRYAGEQWRELWDFALNTSHKLDLLDLSPFAAALLRLDPTAGTFTTLHLLFLRLCMEHGTPSQALPILDKNIYAYPQSAAKNVPSELRSEEHGLSNTFITPKSGFTEKIHPEYVLEYYTLGAHIYISVRNYRRARLFLEHVILHPSQAHSVSAFQAEAYKKCILIGLLTEGKLFPYIKTVDSAVMKSIKALSKAYDALAEDFERRDSRRFQADLDVGMQIWAEDGNLGLVMEAGRALLRYRVSDLQKTYAALPVSRVATHLELSPVDTLDTLNHMIRQSDLNASLTSGASPGEAVLRFHFTPSTNSAADSDLEAQTKRIEELISAVRDADRRLQLTKEHIEISKRNKRAGPDLELAEQMDLTWDAPSGGPMVVDDDAEEDIMA